MRHFTDSNCVQILAPLFGNSDVGACFMEGQHIGHVAKDCAKVLARLMDAGFEAVASTAVDSSDNCNAFTLSCCLSYSDTNRSKLGYEIDIVVNSDNSSVWIDTFFQFLCDHGLKPILIA